MHGGQSIRCARLTGEDTVVVVAHGERADGHDLGDGAEPEVVPIAQLGHVLQAEGRMPERICDQLIEALQSCVLVLWVLEVLQLLRVLAPHLLGPEHPAHYGTVTLLEGLKWEVAKWSSTGIWIRGLKV